MEQRVNHYMGESRVEYAGDQSGQSRQSSQKPIVDITAKRCKQKTKK